MTLDEQVSGSLGRGKWQGLTSVTDDGLRQAEMHQVTMFLALAKKQRILLWIFISGSVLYIILSQAVLVFGRSPGQPTKPEIRRLCSYSKTRTSPYFSQEESEDIPVIYIITPTYKRPEMIAEMTRLGQTLLLVPKVHWIIAEDNIHCSEAITEFLFRLGLPFTHIASPMPEIYRKQKYIPRGVSNRRAALQWIRENGNKNAVLYFLDDDNSVDLRLFQEMRDTKKVSMWPVGLIGDYSVSSPVVSDEEHIIGFFDGWPAGRKFQVDMAGFAVNVGFFKEKKEATMPYIAGYEEDGFLKSLHIELKDIKVKANSCSEILVWHTKTTKTPIRTISPKDHKDDNIAKLLENMRHEGMIR